MITVFAFPADGSETQAVTGMLGASGIGRANGVSTATLRFEFSDVSARLLPKHPRALRNVLVEDHGGHVFSGVVTRSRFQLDSETGRGLVVVDAESDERWLRGRTTYPDPSVPSTSQTTRTHDTHTGVASSVLLAMANVSVGSAALPARQIKGLQFAVDPFIGSSLTISNRWRNLLESMQRVALWANLCFDMRRDRHGVSTLRVWRPRDLRDEVVLTPDRHAVEEATDEQGMPEATAIIGAGSGEGTLRTILEANDAAAIAAWGRYEQFRDQRGATDPAQQFRDLQTDLLEAGETRAITVVPVRGGQWAYGVDYGLGDWVTAGAAPGMTQTQQVQEVKWSTTDTGVSYVALVGAPSATFTGDQIIANRVALSRISHIEEAQ